MIGNALLGQFLSVAITLSGAVNEYLARRYKVNFPALQTVLFYLLLSIVYTPKWLLKRRRKEPHTPTSEVIRRVWNVKGLWYTGYAFLDCIAAILVIRAYLFTNLAIVALLSTISTPCVIVLSRLFLGTQYRPLQYAGAIICVSGVIFFSVNLGLQTMAEGGDTWLGGLLALGSALVYAGSNVLAERLTSGDSYDSDEFLAMTGVAGLAWSMLYMLASGLSELGLFIAQPSPVIALIFLYALSIFGFYSVLPLFLRLASATLFNLSLLTVNIYSALVNMALFQDTFTWSFPISLLIVSVGILVYSY